MRQFIETITSMEAGNILGWAGLASLLGFGAWAFVSVLQSALNFYDTLGDSRRQNQDRDHG